jgi:AcrR family transcriptional regulator
VPPTQDKPKDAANAGPRRRLSASERRERILAAATEVFAERGYADASMGEIARRAGVVASVIYDHFPSKRDLHVHLLEHHGRALIERSIQAVTPASPEEMLRESIGLFVRLVEEDPFAWRFLFRDPPADPEIAAVWRRIHEGATAGIAGLTELATPGIESIAGIERPTAAVMIARASQGATNGLMDWWFEHREVSREQVTAVAVAILWDGFGRMLEQARADAR